MKTGPRKLQEKSLALLKAGNDVSKLIDIDIPKVSIDDAADHYADWLESLIETHSIVMAPYPDIPPKELIEKSYELKKPFKDSGEGHKDYVVWKTVREGVNAETALPPFIFLTNNTKDFCELDQSGKYILHSDLSSQIGVPARKPIIYTSIKAAFDTELSPNLEGMSLDDTPSLENDIDSMVGEFLLQDLPPNSINALDGIPFNDEISISSVGPHTINAVTLKKVGDEVIITVTGTVEIEAAGFMDKSDFYQHDGADVFVVDGNWNDHVMLVSSTIETPFELTIFYSSTECGVTGREVSLLDEIEDKWPYK